MGFLVATLAWLHIFFATGWIGGALLSTIALEPSIHKMENYAIAQTLMANVGKFHGSFFDADNRFWRVILLGFYGWSVFLDRFWLGSNDATRNNAWGGRLCFRFCCASTAYQALATATQKSPKDVPVLMSKIRTLSLVDLVLLALVFSFMVGSAFY